MIRINLLPIQEIEESISRRKEIVLAGGGILATLVLLIFVYFFQYTRLNAVHAELARQESMMGKIRQQYREVEQLERKRKDFETKLKAVHHFSHPGRRTASVHLLDDLSAYTPDNLWLTEFSEIKGATKIHGLAMDNQAIGAFTRNLSNSQYFHKIEIRETAKQMVTGDSYRGETERKINASARPVSLTKFFIEAQISYPGER